MLAGVDQVRVFLTLVGEGAHAEQPVFALQGHPDPVGQVVGHQGGDADAEVNIVPVVQFCRGDGRHFVACPGHDSFLLIGRVGQAMAGASVRGRTVRCSMSFTRLRAGTMRWM